MAEQQNIETQIQRQTHKHALKYQSINQSNVISPEIVSNDHDKESLKEWT